MPTRDPELQEWIDRVIALPDIREDKVQAIRRALAEGSYDSRARLEELFDASGPLGELIESLTPQDV